MVSTEQRILAGDTVVPTRVFMETVSERHSHPNKSVLDATLYPLLFPPASQEDIFDPMTLAGIAKVLNMPYANRPPAGASVDDLYQSSYLITPEDNITGLPPVPAGLENRPWVGAFYCNNMDGTREIHEFRRVFCANHTVDRIVHPDMTSSVTPAGFNASSTVAPMNNWDSRAAWRAFSSLSTGNVRWESQASFDADFTNRWMVAIVLGMVESVPVTHWTLYGVRGSASGGGGHPRDFTLEGSNDGGTTWEVIDTYVDVENLQIGGHKTFWLPQPSTHHRRRLNITRIWPTRLEGDSDSVTIGQIVFRELSFEPADTPGFSETWKRTRTGSLPADLTPWVLEGDIPMASEQVPGLSRIWADEDTVYISTDPYDGGA